MQTLEGPRSSRLSRVEDLSEEELGRLGLRLLSYVRRRAKLKYWWLGTDEFNLGFGEACEDIVQDALASLFGGGRKWNPVEQTDAWKHLLSVANSELDNLAAKRKRRDELGEHQGGVDERMVDEQTGVLDEEHLSPEEALDLRRRRDRAYSLLVDAISPDEQLVRLHDMIEAGEDHAPRLVAAALGITVREVDNLKKRLKRRYDEVLKKLDRECASEGR